MLAVGCATVLCHLFSLLLLPARICQSSNLINSKWHLRRARKHNSNAFDCTSLRSPTINTMNCYFCKLFVSCAWIDDDDADDGDMDNGAGNVDDDGDDLFNSNWMLRACTVLFFHVTAHSNEAMCAAFTSPNR